MRISKFLFIVGSAMVAAGMLGIIIKNANAKEHYLVTDEHGRNYITNYINYQSDCIVFYEPENDIEHKVCGEYKIEKI